MKKYLFPALALGLVMTSCQSDEPFAPGEGGEKQVTFTLNVPGELGTRADFGANKSGVSGVSNEGTANIQYTLVLDADGDKKILDNDDATINGKTATFSPTVVLGREYKITAYASLGDAWNGENAIDITKHFNDETKDAYFYTTTHNFAEGDLQPLALKRPFGKLRLLATDYKLDNSGVLNTAVKNVKITYNDAQAAEFDVFNSVFEFGGNFVNADAQTFGYYGAEEDGAMPIFADYVPANPGDNMVDFTVEVTYTNDETYSRTFNDIPVKRNALTTLKGNFFTAGAEITVKVEDAFDNSINIAATAGQFIEAVNAVEDGQVITLSDNIQFSESARTHNSGTWYDGLYYTGDKSFTIDLNGKTISQDGSVNDYLLNFKNAASTNTRSADSKANTITIKNGTIDAGTAAFCALCTSSVQENQLTINLENVTLINKNSNGSTVKIRGGAILNVKEDTKIIGNDSYLGIEATGTNTEVNIYDGAEIYMNGTSSYNGCLVGVGGNGTINVYGGYGKGVKGGFIAMTSGGTINVSGGEWIANTDGSIGDNSNLYVLTAQSNKYESGFAGPSVINVTGGTFRGGMDAWVLNNLEGEKAEINISGGNFNADPTRFLDEGYSAKVVDGIYQVMAPVAQVGNTKYGSIDDAIANWTHNTTLTLLSDVTLNDVVTLKSTEHHILNLDTYTMTATSGKNAFEIQACGTGAGEQYAITINADATTPGGINADKKAIVYYDYSKGIATGDDRPIIKINGGVFNASTSTLIYGSTVAGIHFKGGSKARQAATLNISGGTFNCSINGSGKSKLLISGGTFNYSVGSQGDVTALRRIEGGKFKTLGFMTSGYNESNQSKFRFGKSMENNDVGLYIDDEGYLVVGGPVITDFGDKFAAKATNATKWNSLLQYSSAAEHGLYYTNADMAIAKHGAANVEVKQ